MPSVQKSAFGEVVLATENGSENHPKLVLEEREVLRMKVVSFHSARKHKEEIWRQIFARNGLTTSRVSKNAVRYE